ncbi:MAG: hypothetical protein QOK49_1568 [Baekduia sp.]|nr:hypothetical protein [Baekduia sp.]
MGSLRGRIAAAVVAAALGSGASAHAQAPASGPCEAVSPSQAPCTLQEKALEAPQLDASTRARAVADYQLSWVHRTVAFQSRLGDPLPLTQGAWIGTHNSFNALANGFTLSHGDSNQQLTLSEQLDVDVRSIELDLHVLQRPEGPTVVVCHGRGPDELNLGCTTEPPLSEVLPLVRDWLRAHPHEVLLLYLEDELGTADGYAAAVGQLDAGLRRVDGSSMLLRPADAAAANACTSLPPALTRDAVRAQGAQVVLVGNCRAGWSSAVFGWDDTHVESGDTAGYRPAPDCDATYGRDVYASKLVRYFEDSTVVAQAVSPTTSPAQATAERLTPDKVAAMTACGVDLFGFDQLLPEDGRLAATVWSWAPGEPDLARGDCTVQLAGGRWESAACTGPERHPAACRAADGTWWTTAAIPRPAAKTACGAAGGTFDVPRSGEQNTALRTAAGDATTWIDIAASS